MHSSGLPTQSVAHSTKGASRTEIIPIRKHELFLDMLQISGLIRDRKFVETGEQGNIRTVNTVQYYDF